MRAHALTLQCLDNYNNYSLLSETIDCETAGVIMESFSGLPKALPITLSCKDFQVQDDSRLLDTPCAPSKEIIHLASILGQYSLGYLLQRDKKLKEALSEAPWLVQHDSNNTPIFQHDSFILEELSEAELAEPSESTSVVVETPICISSSVPAFKKTSGVLVKYSLSFKSSGYSSLFSNHSILVDSIQSNSLLPPSPLDFPSYYDNGPISINHKAPNQGYFKPLYM